MPIYSVSLSVLPTSTSRLEGEIIFIFVTFLSMMSAGRSNSSTMQSGIAPPQGCSTHKRFEPQSQKLVHTDHMWPD